jgi:predicted outer membrane repeat protein
MVHHRRVSIARFAAILALLSGMLGAAPVHSAHAATLTVTTTNDSGPGSLREAVLQPAEGNTITFDPTLAGQTIVLASDLILSHNVTIDASALSAPVVLSGGNTSRIMQIIVNANVTIAGLTFTQGASPEAGGAIFMNGSSQLTLKESTFYQNHAEGGGGAIYKQGNGFVSIDDSRFDQNHAGSAGGAILVSGNAPLTILDSTFVDNTAGGDGGAIYGVAVIMKNSTVHRNQSNANGGALAIAGSVNSVISNSTVSGNLADDQGGGIFVIGNSQVGIYNSTFTQNAAGEGHEIALLGNAVLNVHNTIFACTEGSESCSLQPPTALMNFNHSFLAIGTLLDSGLAEIAYNGGPTQTMALLPGSPLIDAGDDSICAGANVSHVDQRGVIRPQGSHCDIGAYEDQFLVRFVKQDARGTSDGSSWANAHTDLQSALAAASPDEEIWVASGSYKPTSTADRTISFTLKNGVAVYGGFAGTETLRDQRNYETNVTVLSGDIGLENDNSDNSYHVVVGSNTNASAILDGFTITAGNANDTAPRDHRGRNARDAERIAAAAGAPAGQHATARRIRHPVADSVQHDAECADRRAAGGARRPGRHARSRISGQAAPSSGAERTRPRGLPD